MTLAMENLSGLVGLSRDGFSVEQLEDCAKCLRGALLQDFVFCKGHPFMTRLSATLERGSDAERGAALEAMAWVAKNPANSEPILFALEESGESLEKYTAQHTHLDGHRDKADDAIYRNLLSLLMCSSGFTFRASQLLELTDGKMGTALAALAAVLRGPFGQPPMQELLKGDPLLWRSNVQLVTCAIKVLCDFTTCDAYFLSTDARDYQSIDIVQLNKEFTRSITEVSRALLQYPIFDLIAVHLEEWFQVVKKGCSSSMQGVLRIHGATDASLPQVESAAVLLEYLETSLGSALMTVSHLLTYTTQYSARLRKFIANHTILIQNLVLPFTQFLCDALERTDTDDAREAMTGRVKQLLYIVKVLSFVTFRVKVFRPWFRERNFSLRLLRSDVLLRSNLRASVVALLARLNVNVDAGDSSHRDYAALLAAFRDTFAALPEDEKRRLSRALTSPVEAMYPVNKLCKSYADLRFLWDYCGGGGTGTGEEAAADAAAAAAAGVSDTDTDSDDGDGDGEGEGEGCLDGDSGSPPSAAGQGVKFEWAFKDADAFTLGVGSTSSTSVSSDGFGRGGGFGSGGGGSGARAAGRYSKGRAAGVGRGGGRTRGGRGRGWGRYRTAACRTRPYQSARHKARQRHLLEQRWKRLRERNQAATIHTPSVAEDAGSDDEAAGAGGGSSGGGCVLEADTSQVRAALQQQSKPDAPKPTPLTTLLGGPGSPTLSCASAPASPQPVFIYRPTKLSPLSSLPMPKGVERNTLFGAGRSPTKLDAAAEGGGSSVSTEGEEGGGATKIIWQPGTDLVPQESRRGSAGGGACGGGDGGTMARFKTTEGGDAAFPAAFLCALTQQLLSHPVLSPYGDVFERSAILKWFADNGNTCPVTSKPLEVTDLVPDYDLRRDIQEYRLKCRVEAVF